MPRYPIRGKRPGRIGAYRSIFALGGAAPEAGYTDDATVYVDIQASSVEIFEAVDSAEVYTDIQVSSVEEYGTTDSAEVYVDIQASGTDTIAHETTDSAEVYVKITPKSYGPTPIAIEAITTSLRQTTTDPHTFSHAGIRPKGVILVGSHGNTTTDRWGTVTYGGVTMTRVETAVASSGGAGNIGVSAAWFLGSNIPAGTQTVSIDYTGFDDDDALFTVYTVTGDGDMEVIDFDEIVDGNLADPALTLQYASRVGLAFATLFTGAGSVAEFTSNGNTTEDGDFDGGSYIVVNMHQSGSGAGDFTIGGTETTNFVAMVALAVAPVTQTADIHEIPDSDTVYVDIQADSVEEYTTYDSIEIYFDIQASGVDEYTSGGIEYIDSDSVLLGLQTSAVEFAEFADTGEAYVDLQSSSVEQADYVEADTIYVDLAASSIDIADFADSSSVLVDLQVDSTEQREVLEVGEVYLDMQPETTVEIADYIETATIYMDLQASGVDTFVIGAVQAYVIAPPMFV